ncbi:hypothetical protein C7999DRAFT_34448 [Corynascus novoguineensis]|uniref:Uncharacterized protein n=1 Tax=Corynascus novoguineensis TaxID=1126955 RepID=A0AAN7CQP8_9PEZI|nr:hypothetical protein C7999DRAFT_34448 [Corynascus novoguineensis]
MSRIRICLEKGESTSPEQDRQDRGGCAWCGQEEWWYPEAIFFGLGEQRRCLACRFHKLCHGVERDPEDWGKDPIPSGQNGCGNCNAPENPDIRFAFSGIYRRCNACHLWMLRYDEERPASVHSADRTKNGCGNCGRPEPEDPKDEKLWRHFGAERRCNACETYKKIHNGKEPPPELEQRRIAELEAVKIKDGCKNPNCLAPESEDQKQAENFRKFGEERRCSRCVTHKRRYGLEWPEKDEGRKAKEQKPRKAKKAD